MTCRASFAALWSRLTGTDTPATGANCHPHNRGGYTPAQIAYPVPSNTGQIELPARRLALILESRRARELRQSKLAAQLERDLRSVNHQMMAIYLGRAK